MNELFADAFDYRNYRVMKKSTRYDEDVGNELKKITKKTDIQVKDPVSLIAFLQDSIAAYNACNIHDGAAMCLFRRYLSSSV